MPRVSRASTLATRLVLFIATIAALASSCAPDQPRIGDDVSDGVQSKEPGIDAASVKAPGFDAQEVIRRVQLGFRAVDGEFVGGSPAHRVRYAAGALELSGAQDHGAAVSLRTLELRREGLTTAHDGDTEVQEDGHLAIERGPMVEHVRNTDHGLQQSFSFIREPQGAGDLEVRVQVIGWEHVGASPQAHHFRAPDHASSLRYGRATWIDADGEATAIQSVHLGGGELALVVPAALVEASPFPAEIDPTIELIQDTDTAVDGYPVGDQGDPRVATDGTDFLVVWNDARWITGKARVHAARVDSNGTLLDPGGLPLSIGFGPLIDHFVDVDYDGTVYVVVVNSGGKIFAHRITPWGTVLDPSGIQLGNESAWSVGASVACGVGVCLVVWSTDSSGGNGDLVGRLIDSMGTPLGPEFVISNAPDNQSKAQLAFTGSHFFVAWEDKRTLQNIYGARVTPTGTVLDPGGIQLTSVLGQETEISVASDGNVALVSYHAETVPLPTMRVARVDASGMVLDPGGIAIDTPTSGQSYYGPGWAYFDGTNFGVMWSGNNSDIQIRRISPSGVLVDPATSVLAAGDLIFRPTMACNPWQCFASWSDVVDDVEREVFGRRVQDTVATDPSDIHVSEAANRQDQVTMSYAHGVYFLAWRDWRSGTDGEIWGARIEPSGNVLDPGGIPIAVGPADASRPQVAASSSGFLVTFESDTLSTDEVHAVRLSPAGVVLDATPIVLETGSADIPTVASDGADYLVAWRSYLPGPGTQPIVAARVSAAGAVLDASPFLVRTDTEHRHVAATFAEGIYFVAIHGKSGVAAVRVDPSSTVLDPSPGISLPALRWPDVVHDGTQFVVGGAVYDSGLSGNRVWAARVTASGTVLDPSGILIGAGVVATNYTSADFYQGPALAFDGKETMITWSDERFAVYAGWFSPAGAVSPIYEVANDNVGRVFSPAVATLGTGAHSLVAYTFGNPATGIRNFRIEGKHVLGRTLSDPCTYGYECKYNECIDGVCCDQPCGGDVTTDCQACTAALTGGVDGECAPMAAGMVCRPGSGDGCDPQELCNGTTLTCPGDVIAPSGSLCRAGSGDVCDPDEHCTGTAGASCPNDIVASPTTVCRPGSGDVCDPDELCTGVAGAACPVDIVVPAATSCRFGSGDGCDPDEACTGVPGAPCPADVVAPASTVCRAGSGDACDPDEHCSGTSGAACPTDIVASAGTLCRAGSGDACDPDETCSGVPKAACPTDVLQPPTTVCRFGSGDLCDPDELCPGSPGGACPTDIVAPTTTVCRSGSGDLCDPDELCSGNPGAGCPADVVQPNSTLCRSGSGDVCDPDELCTGAPGAGCPADVITPPTTVCRSGSGDICDPDELCPGTPGDACPGDVVAPTTTVCRVGSGDLCDPDEQCPGAPSAACPPDVVQPSTTMCRAGSGDLCDPDEVCTGTAGAACPVDVLEPTTTVCRAGTGDPCDPDELCTGNATQACPADVVAAAGTTCRDALSTCDVTESCVGDGSPCPVDAVATDGTNCDDGDECTQTDVCEAGLCAGDDPVVCPSEGECFEAGVCNSATGQCDASPVPDGQPCSKGSCQAGACVDEGQGGSNGQGGDGAGGVSGVGGASAPPPSAGEGDTSDGGCGCNVVGARDTASWPWTLLGLIALARRRCLRAHPPSTA